MNIVQVLAEYGPWGILVGVVAYIVIRLIDRGFTFQVPPKRR